MAALNRTELEASIDTYIVPTVTNAIDRVERKKITESAVMKKHKVADHFSGFPAGGTLDFANTDTFYATLTGYASNTIDYTITNLQMGQTGYIVFNGIPALGKGRINFTNATYKRKNMDAPRFSEFGHRVVKVTNYRGTIIAEYVGNDVFTPGSGFDFEDFDGMNLDFYADAFSGAVNSYSANMYESHIQVISRSIVTMIKVTTLGGNVQEGEIYTGSMLLPTWPLAWRKVTQA